MHMFFSSDVIQEGFLDRKRLVRTGGCLSAVVKKLLAFSFGLHYISVDFTVGQIVNPALIGNIITKFFRINFLGFYRYYTVVASAIVRYNVYS